MEWIDEEEQRQKYAAPIAASVSSSAASPPEVRPLDIDDFLSQWLHPNWSHVSCAAKFHLSPEQVQTLIISLRKNSNFLSAQKPRRGCHPAGASPACPCPSRPSAFSAFRRWRTTASARCNYLEIGGSGSGYNRRGRIVWAH